MHEIQASLERLERREWWRWTSALLIMLLLIVAIFVLAVPGSARDTATQSQLNMAVKGLFALVLLFDVFAIFQQIKISRLRRQLAGQIGVLAALETLKPTPPEEQEGQKERRRSRRHPFDQRLKATITRDGKEEILHGRVIDVSELGLGSVIAGSLERGQRAVLEFRTGAGSEELKLEAVVRYARGFRHGFEFTGVNATELEVLRHAIAGASVAAV